MKSVVEKVITRATPGRSLVLNMQKRKEQIFRKNITHITPIHTLQSMPVLTGMNGYDGYEEASQKGYLKERALHVHQRKKENFIGKLFEQPTNLFEKYSPI